MKFISFYEDKMKLKQKDEIFNYFIRNLNETIYGFDYFNDWEKIHINTYESENEINLLNKLIGSVDFEKEFKNLIKTNPKVIRIIPQLLAIRKTKINVRMPNEKDRYNINGFSFIGKKEMTEKEIDDIYKFVSGSNLELIFDGRISNLMDFLYGVELGIDTNGRKNRGGKYMEKEIESYIKELKDKKGYEYIREANSKKIKKEFGIELKMNKNERRYDFAIKTDKKLILVETNFFNGGGTKLKSVAGEFVELNHFMKENNPDVDFIWLTDGVGWRTTKSTLNEAFESMDYIFNLKMLENGILEEF